MDNDLVKEQICSLLCQAKDMTTEACELQSYNFIGVCLFVVSELIGVSPHTSSSGVFHSILKFIKIK